MDGRRSIIQRDIRDYLSEVVSSSYENQEFESSFLARDYLVNLLVDFIDKGRFIDSQRDNRFLFDQTNAELMLDEERSPFSQKLLNLLKVGDRSLFLTGFFPQCLERRIVGVDYYIDCGQYAYQKASNQIENRIDQDEILYKELARNFRSFVGILNETADRCNMSDDSLVRLYRYWFNEDNQRLEKLLKEKGLLPLHSSREQKILQ